MKYIPSVHESQSFLVDLHFMKQHWVTFRYKPLPIFWLSSSNLAKVIALFRGIISPFWLRNCKVKSLQIWWSKKSWLILSWRLHFSWFYLVNRWSLGSLGPIPWQVKFYSHVLLPLFYPITLSIPAVVAQNFTNKVAWYVLRMKI